MNIRTKSKCPTAKRIATYGRQVTGLLNNLRINVNADSVKGRRLHHDRIGMPCVAARPPATTRVNPPQFPIELCLGSDLLCLIMMGLLLLAELPVPIFYWCESKCCGTQRSCICVCVLVPAVRCRFRVSSGSQLSGRMIKAEQ